MTLTNTPTFTPTNTIPPNSAPIFSLPYPNPSYGSPISFQIQVPYAYLVTMDVFSVALRKITSQSIHISGSQTLQWNLKDKSGIQAANGFYWVRFQFAGKPSATKILKVLVLR
jgi:hypothetical protein